MRRASFVRCHPATSGPLASRCWRPSASSGSRSFAQRRARIGPRRPCCVFSDVCRIDQPQARSGRPGALAGSHRGRPRQRSPGARLVSRTGGCRARGSLGRRMFRFWDTRDYLAEGRRHLEAMLALPAPISIRVGGSGDRGCSRTRTVASGLWRLRSRLYESIGAVSINANRLGELRCLSCLALVDISTRELDRAERWIRAADEIAREIDAPAARADVDYARGALQRVLGRNADAEASMSRAFQSESRLEIARRPSPRSAIWPRSLPSAAISTPRSNDGAKCSISPAKWARCGASPGIWKASPISSCFQIGPEQAAASSALPGVAHGNEFAGRAARGTEMKPTSSRGSSLAPSAMRPSSGRSPAQPGGRDRSSRRNYVKD